jgi:lysine 2,3-aminomutase
MDLLVAHKPQQSKNLVETEQQLYKFLQTTLPDEVPFDQSGTRMQTRDEFIQDVLEGITAATMAVRMT